MRRIMVATDGSDRANRAIDVAAGLAKAIAGDLLIATIADSQLEEEAQPFARVEGNVGDALEALAASRRSSMPRPKPAYPACSLPLSAISTVPAPASKNEQDERGLFAPLRNSSEYASHRISKTTGNR